MRYYFQWLWHRLTCRGCYEKALLHFWWQDQGRSYGEGVIYYIVVMLALSLILTLIGKVMGYA